MVQITLLHQDEAKEGRSLCVCVCVEHRAHGLSPLSERQSKADIYMLRPNECNPCVGNELIQLA